MVTELLGKEYKENVTAGILALGAFADLLGSPVGGRFILHYSQSKSPGNTQSFFFSNESLFLYLFCIKFILL